MADHEGDRIEGVDLSAVDSVFADVSYPITADEVVAEYGDVAIERTNAGPITIRELFEPMGPDTYGSTEELRSGLLTLMPKESVGRQRYSDRGLTIDEPGEDRREDRQLPGHEVGEDQEYRS